MRSGSLLKQRIRLEEQQQASPQGFEAVTPVDGSIAGTSAGTGPHPGTLFEMFLLREHDDDITGAAAGTQQGDPMGPLLFALLQLNLGKFELWWPSGDQTFPKCDQCRRVG